jgi:TraY domain-containing protein
MSTQVGCTDCRLVYNAAMTRPRKQPDRHRQKTVSFRLPEELMGQLRRLAERNRRTLSGEARVAFETHLAANGLSYPVGDLKRDA